MLQRRQMLQPGQHVQVTLMQDVRGQSQTTPWTTQAGSVCHGTVLRVEPGVRVFVSVDSVTLVLRLHDPAVRIDVIPTVRIG
jgi:hypothetical protein